MIISLDAEADPSTLELLRDYRDLTDVALRTVSEMRDGIFIAEGHETIGRATLAGYKIRSILCQEKWLASIEPWITKETPVLVGSKEMLEKTSGFTIHRGALASMLRKPLPVPEVLLANARRVLVLEGLVNHTNVGAIVRSAAAFGFDALLIDQYCADPLYRRSIRTSMGTIFSLPWTRLRNWPESANVIRNAGLSIVALTPDTSAPSISTVELPDRYALVLGTEGDGLRSDTINTADFLLRIPMNEGIDSLNVAVAAAVAMYALTSIRMPDFNG
ncbi:MAG TPA: RNA methyltransferase [Candidatus Nanopelagicaceae bacterium]|nr:RNA methyltransferase [Candidatus Nanopelagicaceae bacterium]